jgi:hypothetical protein
MMVAETGTGSSPAEVKAQWIGQGSAIIGKRRPPAAP